MAFYLIDYENVSYNGLVGIDNLNSDDSVHIFHNKNTGAIPFKFFKNVISSKAKIDFIETTKVAKNYLDFQLTTHLGFLFGSGYKDIVYIISNDCGYNSVIDYWALKGYQVLLKPAICINCDLCSILTNDFVKDNDDNINISDNAFQNEPNNNMFVFDTTYNESTIINYSKSSVAAKNKSLTYSDAEYKNEVRNLLKGNKLTPQNFLDIYTISKKSHSKQELHNSLVAKFGKNKGLSLYNSLKAVFTKYKKGA